MVLIWEGTDLWAILTQRGFVYLSSVNFCVLEPVSCAIGPAGDGTCGADGGAQGGCVGDVGCVEQGWEHSG